MKRSTQQHQGFQDKLKELIEAAGGSVEYAYQNAANDSANCSTIVNGFVSSGVDLIMANATPALQAAQAATADIPILGTSISDYGTALGVDTWTSTSTSGTNISGTTDLAPLDGQAEMLQELFPDAKNVGLLFCSAEPNFPLPGGHHQAFPGGDGLHLHRVRLYRLE